MIFIEAESVRQAKLIFFNRFGHYADEMICPSCGEDYIIDYHEDIHQLTGPSRSCKIEGGKYVEKPIRKGSRTYLTLEEYKKKPELLFILVGDITEEDLKGSLPWDRDW